MTAAELRALLLDLIRPGVSDVFITAGKPPSVRADGKVRRITEAPPVEAAAVDELRCALLDSRAGEVYFSTGGYDAPLTLDNRRCRVNFLSTLNGPALILRPINSGGELDFSALRLPAEALRKLAALERGIVFFAGGTGSGKTTSMNAMVNYINSNFQRHIITLEDPIEFIHQDKLSLVTQREIRSGGFGLALRNAVRENPDVIVLGEMRDADSVQSALGAALTGHLVLATVHCTDSVSVIERLLGFFPESVRLRVASDLSLSLEAVLAQRLLPGISGGMVPAVELLLGTSTVRRQLAQCSLDGLAMALLDGGRNGMLTFNHSLYELVDNGEISRKAALDASDSPEELELVFKGMRRGSATADDPAVQLSGIDMRDLFRSAVRLKASDLVLSLNTPPMLRINGEMQALALPKLSTGDIRRLLFSVIDRRHRAVFEERRELDFSLSVTLGTSTGERKEYRFRLNAYFQRGVPALVARVLETTIPLPEELHLPPVLLDLILRNQGLILITGPSGSGKSTTLASLLDFVNHRRRAHIITIEDPIEFVYANDLAVIEQREVYSDTLNFSEALRSALRQAPDVIMVGELRDTETIAAALTAAETGHLVLGTIHTNSAAQTVDRIIDSFPRDAQNQIRQQFASCLLAVVSQRLLRRVDGKGRAAAFEIMVGTPAVKALIREAKVHMLESSIETGANEGMQTMRRALEELLKSGVVTEEACRTLER